MDGVEIVTAVEETYDIRIEDAEAEAIRTPRQLIELIWEKVARVDSSVCLSHRTFNRLRGLLIRRCSLPREAITPAARVSTLLPEAGLQRLINAVPDEFETGPIPLVRPKWIARTATATPILAGVATSFLSILLGIIVLCASAFASERSTRRFRTQLPGTLASVSDLSGWILAHSPKLATPSQRGWTREQIALRVRQIVTEILQCDSYYREDALFVEELGLS